MVERVDASHLRSFPEEQFSQSPRTDIWLLTLATGLLCFAGLGFGPDLSDHEAIIGQGARETLQSDNWLIPRVNGEVFVRKPPLPIWLATWTSKLVGSASLPLPVSTLATRLPSAVAGWLTALLVYFLGRAMYGHRIAMVSSLVMASCAGGLMFAHRAEVEMTLTLMSAGAFAAFWMATESGSRIHRGWLIAFYAFLALAMFAKAPMPLAVVMAPLAVWWFVAIPILNRLTSSEFLFRGIRLQLRRFLTLLSIPGILLFLAIVVPWPIYIYRNVDHVMDLWWLEFGARYTGDMSESPEPFWYFIPMVFLLALPFCLSIPEAVATSFLRSYQLIRRPLAFNWTWFAIHFLVVSGGSYKRSHYLASCLPAIALLLGPTLDRLFFTTRSMSRRGVASATIGFVIVAIIGGIAGGIVLHQKMPALAWTGTLVIAIAAIGIAAACHFFFHGRRRASFLSLVAMSGAVFVAAWVGVGRTDWLDYKPREMARVIREANIPPTERIIWAVGRPDPRLAWQLGRPIPPLLSAMELASMRKDRKTVSEELQIRIANEISARLKSSTPEYLVIDVKYWNTFTSFFDTPARVVHRLRDPFESRDGDNWMLVTNAWNTKEGTE